jgi:hypothetical protein
MNATEAKNHLTKAGILFVDTNQSKDLHDDICAAGFVDAKPLLAKWAMGTSKPHETVSSMKEWMETFNVHLKRLSSQPGQVQTLLWWNGIVNCAERLKLRLSRTVQLLEVTSNPTNGSFGVLLATEEIPASFGEWYQARLTFKDPQTERQDLAEGQQPNGSMMEHLHDKIYIFRVMCTDQNVAEQLMLDFHPKPPRRVVSFAHNIVLEFGGILHSEATGGIYMARIVDGVRGAARR